MDSSNLDIGTVLRDPDFQGLSTIEKRKFLLDADSDFRNLPVGEQSKFIISLTPSSGQIPPENPSAFDYKGVGGPVTGIALKAVPQLYQDIKEQVAPSGLFGLPVPEIIAGPPGMRPVLDTAKFIKNAVTQTPTQTAEELGGSVIPLPAAKIGKQLGEKKYVEAATSTALPLAELIGLGAIGKAAAGKPYNPVTEGLTKLGEGIDAPYIGAKIAEKSGFLASESGATRDAIMAARDMDIAKFDLAKATRENPVKTTGPEGALDRALVIDRHARKLWQDEHVEPMERNAAEPFDTNSVVEKVRSQLTPEVVADATPARVKAAEEWLDRTVASKPHTLSSIDGTLRVINNTLDSPSAPSAYDPLMVNVKRLTGDAIREGIDAKLDSLGEVGVKPSNQRYGALRNVAQRIVQKAISEDVSKAKTSIPQRLLHTYAYFSSRSPLPHGGIAINPGGFYSKAPSRKIAQGLDKLAESGIEPIRPSLRPVPFNPASLAPQGSPARLAEPKVLPPIRTYAQAHPDEPTSTSPTQPEGAPTTQVLAPSTLVQEASRRLALNKLKNALNKNEPLSTDQTEFLKSKGVDIEKAGALGEAHRVIQGELAKLTGKGTKATPKQGSPIPPVPEESRLKTAKEK